MQRLPSTPPLEKADRKEAMTAIAWAIQNQVSWRTVANPELAEKPLRLVTAAGEGAASGLVLSGDGLAVDNIDAPDTDTGFGSTFNVTYFSVAGSKYENVTLGVRVTGACGIRT